MNDIGKVTLRGQAPPIQEEKKQVTNVVVPDSLSKAPLPETLLDFTPSRPKLDPPSSIAWRVIETTIQLEEVATKLSELSQKFTENVLERIKKANSEEAEKVREAIKREQEAQWWDFLKDIGQVILAGLSAVFGIALVGSGGGALVGGMMIASGVLAIINFVMQKVGAWDELAHLMEKDDETMAEVMKTYLPASIGILSALFGLAGTVAAGFFLNLDAGQKMLLVFETASSLASNTTTIAGGVTKARVYWAQSDLIKARGIRELLGLRLTQATESMQQLAKNQADQTELVQSIIRSNLNAMRVAQQSV